MLKHIRTDRQKTICFYWYETINILINTLQDPFYLCTLMSWTYFWNVACTSFTGHPVYTCIFVTGENKKAKEKSEIVQNIQHFLQPATQRPLKLILIYFFCSHCASLIGLRPFLVPIFESLSLPIEAKWVVVSLNMYTYSLLNKQI